MKKYLVFLFLFCLLTLALDITGVFAATKRWLIVVIDKTLPNADAILLRDKIYNQLNDNKKIKYSDLRDCHKGTNQGHAMAIDITGKNLPWNKDQAATWTSNNLSQPEKVWWRATDNITQALAQAEIVLD